ncbi:MAG: bifunctional DNA-formamidopyrimidine glycosylase/DNA-(apurinic or apyrimidinic site) lyase [Chloroflexi bacterium]|nr:bifunctional DNA-formamidopyrimidine glycosylase/DNA-(apurinic or apyrimidinic site) lyase [Chloroflexota bacterium]
MPELPEVETIKNELTPIIIGRTITGVTLLWEKMVRQPSLDEFRSRLTGRKITSLSRRGKYLLIRLNGEDWLVIHLKMTGALIVSRDLSEPPRFTRAIIELDDGSRIFFRDPRKFGMMQLVKDTSSVVGDLGPEPLEPGFTPALLAEILAGRKAPIKAILCDQNIIAGIGNMYADETLFRAKIHPLRTGASLTPDEVRYLHRAIIDVLRAGIENKGASVENYFRPDGSKGTAHIEFRVAHQRGEPCCQCGTPIERIAVRGRGTYFCPKCQLQS